MCVCLGYEAEAARGRGESAAQEERKRRCPNSGADGELRYLKASRPNTFSLARPFSFSYQVAPTEGSVEPKCSYTGRTNSSGLFSKPMTTWRDLNVSSCLIAVTSTLLTESTDYRK